MSARICLSLLLGILVGGAAVAEPKPDPKPEPKPAPAPEKPKPEPKPAAKPEPKAESAKAEAKQESGKEEEKDENEKTVASLTKDHQRLGGLFPLFLDEEKGALLMLVPKSALKQEFIYFTKAMDGVVQAGYNRGQFGAERIIAFRKVFNRIQILQRPTSFYFDPQHPLARAAEANTSDAVLASEVVMAEDRTGYLIQANGLFLKETLNMVKRPLRDGAKPVLGKLSDSKTHLKGVRNFPENTLVRVAYVYENPSPSWMSRSHQANEIADPRFITIQIQHALIRMPDNDYRPRRDDARVGYFMTQVTDMTSPDLTPYRDMIHRWDLRKKKPGTELSEPVEPIVFWIENTTPVEFRDTIRKAALRWNEAFEKAGFKNALVIRQQPNNAKWHADDIRYNVLRWTSSPNPPFGGYGPSFVNPRTGQILGADIMLEFSFISRRMQTRRVLGEVGLAGLTEENATDAGLPGHQCLAGQCAHHGVLFGLAAQRLAPASDRIEVDALLHDALHYLVLHEIGHTLGLNHNFKSSHLHDAKQIHNKARTRKMGLMGSVMDYPSVNLAPEGIEQGEYYITGPGPYDDWAIEYGYSEGLEDPVNEEERLDAIAARSHEPGLLFGNDADDMRSVGRGMDPRAMLFDLSSQPMVYAGQRAEFVNQRLGKLLERGPEPGDSWQQVVQDYSILTGELSNAMVVVSRYVGGVLVDRSTVGQTEGSTPLIPVAGKTQMQALELLDQHVFAPSAWSVPARLASHLQEQRRGFNFSGEAQDPQLHYRFIKIQRGILDHLLHRNTLTRLTDSALYGDPISVNQLLERLTAAIVDGDPDAKPSSVRQNLQSVYVGQLLKLVDDREALSLIQAAAHSQLMRLQDRLDKDLFEGAPEHRELLRYKIRRGLDL